MRERRPSWRSLHIHALSKKRILRRRSGRTMVRPRHVALGTRSCNRMLKSYQLQNGGLKGTVLSDADPIPANAIWIDLFDPSDNERHRVNALLGVEMPTRADMEEIEV